MLTEKDLLELGFYKEDGDEFYYYCLDFGTLWDKLTLISNANDQAAESGSWTVYIFGNETFAFDEKYQLEKMIEILNYAMKTRDKITK